MTGTSERLDARGLLCPLPVIRLQEAIKGLNPGTTIRVEATDPGTQADIPAWCRVHGHRLLDAQEQGDLFHFLIQVAE